MTVILTPGDIGSGGARLSETGSVGPAGSNAGCEIMAAPPYRRVRSDGSEGLLAAAGDHGRRGPMPAIAYSGEDMFPDTELLIDGRWRPGATKRSLDVLNPATGEVIDLSAPAATTGRARPSEASRPQVLTTAKTRLSGMTNARITALARTVRRSWKIGTAMATTAGPSSQLIQLVACRKSS